MYVSCSETGPSWYDLEPRKVAAHLTSSALSSASLLAVMFPNLASSGSYCETTL